MIPNQPYPEYLKTLNPYANASSTRLTAPTSMLDKLTEIAFRKRTNRLDVIRLALAKLIDEEGDPGD